MKAFDNHEFEQYKEEVKQRWGNTKEYQEYTEKSKTYTDKQERAFSEEMGLIFQKFAMCLKSNRQPDSEEAQNLVQELQDYITNNFYNCNKTILASLGQMYVADNRFKNYIDQYAEGTTEFVSHAIEFYCK